MPKMLANIQYAQITFRKCFRIIFNLMVQLLHVTTLTEKVLKSRHALLYRCGNFEITNRLPNVTQKFEFTLL